jgi:hypothetical protein
MSSCSLGASLPRSLEPRPQLAADCPYGRPPSSVHARDVCLGKPLIQYDALPLPSPLRAGDVFIDDVSEFDPMLLVSYVSLVADAVNSL